MSDIGFIGEITQIGQISGLGGGHIQTAFRFEECILAITGTGKVYKMHVARITKDTLGYCGPITEIGQITGLAGTQIAAAFYFDGYIIAIAGLGKVFRLQVGRL